MSVKDLVRGWFSPDGGLKSEAWVSKKYTADSPLIPYGTTMREFIRMRGEVSFHLTDVNTGKLDAVFGYNALMTGMQEQVAKFLANNSPVVPSHVGVGNGVSTDEAISGWATASPDVDLDLTNSGSYQKIAFITESGFARQVSYMLIKGKRIGTPAGTLNVTIQTSVASAPSGSVVTGGTATPVTLSTFPTSNDWVKIVFPDTPALTDGTDYWFVFETSGYTYSNGVTEASIAADNQAAAYDGLKEYNGSVWSSFISDRQLSYCRIVYKQTTGYAGVGFGPPARVALTTQTNPSAGQARLLGVYAASEAVERHGAAGLFSALVSGTQFAGITIDINKTNQQQLSIYWVINVSLGS